MKSGEDMLRVMVMGPLFLGGFLCAAMFEITNKIQRQSFKLFERVFALRICGTICACHYLLAKNSGNT
jgi:mannose/fructose/N-acetylgalactosamine-specific phosphotransferase system component IIC